MIRTGLRSSLLGLLVKPFFGRSWKNGFRTSKRLQWSRTAGTECTFSWPSYCPVNGVHLKIQRTKASLDMVIWMIPNPVSA